MLVESISEKTSVLAAIVNSSQDAIISKNLDGVITSWNKAAEKMFGYVESEVLGKHITIIIPADRLPEEDMIISTLRQGNTIDRFQTIRVGKFGQLVHIDLSVSPIRDAKGVIVGASKIARDITRQKEDEAIIAQYVRRLEVINEVGKALSSMLDVDHILQKTTDATTLLCNAAFGAFFYNKTNSEGESYLLFTLSGAPREAFEQFGMPRNTDVFDVTFSGRGTLRSDDIRKDSRYGKNSPHHGMPKGHLPVVSYLAVPVKSLSGVVIGGLFFGHPEAGKFTGEHELLVEAVASQAGIALENAKLYQELQTISKRKDDFIGFTSHELKTPLTSLAGYAQLIEQNPALASELAPKLNAQVNRLSNIISDLMDVSRIQSGRFDLNRVRVNFRNFINDVVESARQLSASHEITVDLPMDAIVIDGDPVKLNQVFMNVFSNAIKFSQQNKTIALSAERLGDTIEVRIQDHGIGMGNEHLDKIFTQFYRVDNEHFKTSGMGIGLFLCKEFIVAHHGKIWAESSPGLGTTVHISLPIEKIDDADKITQ